MYMSVSNKYINMYIHAYIHTHMCVCAGICHVYLCMCVFAMQANVFTQVKFMCEYICRLVYDLLNGQLMSYDSINSQGFMTFSFQVCNFIILVRISIRKQLCKYQENLPNLRADLNINQTY